MNILTIDQLRERKYSSQLKIEEQVKDEEKFTSYIASYDSDGLKIYGYLVLPKQGNRHEAVGNSKENAGTNAYSLLPKTDGSQALLKASLLIFCHGRIEPKEYLPERQYSRHCEYLGEQGFVVFKPDYRGHGNSQGEVETIFESGYAVDVLNAISALLLDSRLRGNDKGGKIGIMGHSLGGNIALKVMEVRPDIKAGVIWGGAVISADQILEKWFSDDARKSIAEELIKEYGEPKENPEFWKSISPINFVEYINGSVLIQHGEKDESIPTSQAKQLEAALKLAGKEVALILYENGTHNFEGEIYTQAIQKATNFFQSKLKCHCEE